MPGQATPAAESALPGEGSAYGCDDRRSVKVYRKGDYVHFEQLLDDRETKVKVTMSIWVSRDARTAGYFMIALRPSAPGNAGGHLYSRGASPLSPNALRGLIPQCSARDHAEEFIRSENKKNRYYREDADLFGSKGLPDSTVYPVKITKKGTFMHFSEDFVDVFRSNKSLSLTVTEDRRYLSFVSLAMHGDTQGISSGSFWSEGPVAPASFHGIIPKSLARNELEKFLTAPTYTADGDDPSDAHGLPDGAAGFDPTTALPFGWTSSMPSAMGPGLPGPSSQWPPQSFPQMPSPRLPSPPPRQQAQFSRLGSSMPGLSMADAPFHSGTEPRRMLGL